MRLLYEVRQRRPGARALQQLRVCGLRASCARLDRLVGPVDRAPQLPWASAQRTARKAYARGPGVAGEDWYGTCELAEGPRCVARRASSPRRQSRCPLKCSQGLTDVP